MEMQKAELERNRLAEEHVIAQRKMLCKEDEELLYRLT